MSHVRGDARKRACTCPGESTSEHCPTHVDLLARPAAPELDDVEALNEARCAECGHDALAHNAYPWADGKCRNTSYMCPCRVGLAAALAPTLASIHARADITAVLSAAADDLNQHAHTYADTLTPAQYAQADIALSAIGLNLNRITNAAWHYALLDAAGRIRAAAIHEAAS